MDDIDYFNFIASLIFTIIAVIGNSLVLIILSKPKLRKESLSEVWSPDSLHHLSYGSSTMIRDRFVILASYITFDDLITRQNR